MLICSFQVRCQSKVTPSNFAVGSYCTDFSFDLIRKRLPSLVFLDENTILSSLSLLETRPLYFDNFKSSEISFSSVLIVGIVFAFEFDLYILVSSAYWIEFNSVHVDSLATSTLNKTGPKILPCGTTKYISNRVGCLSFTWTYCFQLVR